MGAKTGKDNLPYKASNGGFLEFYGKRGISPKVNSGRETKRKRGYGKRFAPAFAEAASRRQVEAFPNGSPLPV